MSSFTLNKSPELKASLRQTLALLVSTAEGLNATHGSPRGLEIFTELSNLSASAAALFKDARREQSDRSQVSKKMYDELCKIHNSVSSVKAALEKQDVLGMEVIEEIRSDVLSGVRNFKRQSIEANLLAQENAREQASTTGSSDVMDEIASGERMDRLYERISNLLDEYTKYQSQMPNANSVKYKNSRIVMLRLPILMVASAVNRGGLERTGIKFKMVQEYPVLEDQTVIGINLKLLASQEIDADEFISTVVQQYSTRSGRRWTLVMEKPSNGRYGFSYYWIMEDSRLTKLMSATYGGADGWGFPFKT